MNKVEKYKAMEKILRELDDLKNSQTAVIKKIGQIETENMNLNNQVLEKSLLKIYDGVYQNLQVVEELHQTFGESVKGFKAKENITDEMLMDIKA